MIINGFRFDRQAQLARTVGRQGSSPKTSQHYSNTNSSTNSDTTANTNTSTNTNTNTLHNLILWFMVPGGPAVASLRLLSSALPQPRATECTVANHNLATTIIVIVTNTNTSHVTNTNTSHVTNTNTSHFNKHHDYDN